ncbi:MAG: hypothetical protein QM820_43550 [Minicystis sp.]
MLAELERVVQSPVFGGSARQVRLLRFLVGEVLAGRGGALSAARIATHFFERPEGFDSTADSSVRVEMSKLRRGLERHYAVTSAAVRIALPRGSAAPVFVAAADPAGARPAPEGDARAVESGAGRRAGTTDGPVLAVLPFTGINTASGAFMLPSMGEALPPDQSSRGARVRALARGLTDQLGVAFARYPGVVVISRATNLDEAAAQGARYVLEGSVRLVRGTLRVTAKLHDTVRGLQVWGNTYDRREADDRLLEAEDEIAREIAVHLLAMPYGAVHVIEAQERAGRPPRSAYEVVLLLPRWLAAFDPELQAEIEDACADIVPTEADEGIFLALSSFFHLLSTWTAQGSAEDRRGAVDEARRAVVAEPNLANAHQALAFGLLDTGDGRGALAAAEIALALGGPLMLTGLVMALSGDWERGTAIIRAHVGALKRHPGAVRHAFALDAYRRGDYAAALAEAEAIASPNLAWDPLDRAVALARLGRLVEARAAAAALTAILPEAARDPRAVVARLTTDPGLREELLIGLGLAGLG